MAKTAPNSRTKLALLAYGIDSELANVLVQGGHSVTALKALPIDALVQLGLSTSQARAITFSGRPPIPDDTLSAVLYKSRWTCCICRDHKKGVIVHHLSSWSESRSHDADNLVVLCLDHHGEAHTSRELSLTLTADRIRQARTRWYEEADGAVKQEAEKLANMIRQDHRLFSPHRGAMPWSKDTSIIFGNDGYSPTGSAPRDMRSCRQIEIVRQLLRRESINELAFATSTDSVTWVLVVSSSEVSFLSAMIWVAFEQALKEGAGET
jgi:hypothetical protein